MKRLISSVLTIIVGTTMVVLLSSFITPAMAQKTIHVETYGVNSEKCGNKKDPCRTINQAIANADSGNKIVVGPGIYGNLNDDEDLDDPGEEYLPNDVRQQCGCAIWLTKSVTLLSAMGASSTTVTVGKAQLQYAIRIDTDGVTVGGDYGSGFSLVAPGYGTAIGGTGHQLTLIGNVGILPKDAPRAFNIAGDNAVIQGNMVAALEPQSIPYNVVNLNGSNGLVVNNLVLGARAPGTAFRVWGGGNQVTHNTSIGMRDGGFEIVGQSSAQATVVRSNKSMGSLLGIGFGVRGNVTLTENMASGNDVGVYAMGGGSGFPSIVRNTILDNSCYGIEPYDPEVTISENNIYGNGWQTCAPGGIEIHNCGLLNRRGGGTLIATNNFWGASTGPGSDPADEVCNIGEALTVFEPFATEPFELLW